MATTTTAPLGQTLGSLSEGKRWTILALLCIGFMVAYFDRVTLSVALADKEGFLKYFQLTNRDRGLLNSAFFWSYALLQIPAGWLVDRYGVKWTYALGFLLWSVTSAATGLVSGFHTLFLLRILLGIGESVVTPAAMRWIRFNFDEQRRGTAVGILMAAAKLGPAVGNFLAAKLLLGFGWQMMFLIIGAGSLLWLVPWVFLMKNDDRAREQQAKQVSGGQEVSLARVMASPVIWGTIVGTFCYQYFVYFALTWMPAYFKESFHMSLNDSSIFTAASFLCMAVIATLGGFAADSLIAGGRDAVTVRRSFTIAGFVTAALGLVGALNTPAEVAMWMVIASLGGLGLTTANYWALTQTLIPGGAVGRIVGVQNCAANIPGIVAPILTAWLIDVTGGYRGPIMAVLFFLCLGVTMYLTVINRKYAPQAT
ncbi:MFS transporter [Bryobacter aggregatus]|uniref:MFS transporter n=1 Tax=Bryobacter aggregatus TaxID=360054 RepID=UPI0012BA6E8F|nr:MFS transporter [Bryobacter aggregatus]